MPRKPITVRRWEVVASFVAMVVIAGGSAWFTDYRIDRAEQRIKSNTESVASVEAAATAARAVADVARRLAEVEAAAGRRADRKICVEVEKVKVQLVSTLRSNRGQARSLVGRIPGYTAADARAAEMRLQEALRRFEPKECPPE
jgi:hypothetical protein